jgi:hypothetical protein
LHGSVSRYNDRMPRKKLDTLSDQIKAAIAASGLSLNQVAKGAGIKQPSLWRFMAAAGKSHRDIYLEKTADKLAAYFGMRLTKPVVKRK